MKLIAKKNFSLNGVFYEKGDEVIADTKNQAVKLNELGFIEPLKTKDIQNFDNNKSKIKEEVKNKIKEEE